MISEKFDINAFQEALQELTNADGPEEMAGGGGRKIRCC